MKKIVVIEDEKEYRERWKDFFAEFGKCLKVETEIPDEILGFPKLFARWLIEDAYFILDHNFHTPAPGRWINGSIIMEALLCLGIENRVLMSSEEPSLHERKGVVDVGKLLDESICHKKTLCSVASLLHELESIDEYEQVRRIVLKEDNLPYILSEDAFDGTSQKISNAIKLANFAVGNMQILRELFAGEVLVSGGLSNEDELAILCPNEFLRENDWSICAKKLHYRGGFTSWWKWKFSNKGRIKRQYACFDGILSSKLDPYRKFAVAGWMLSEMLESIPRTC